MADKKDDEAEDWGAALDGQQAPGVGINKEVLRKAMSLNPTLRQGQDSTDIMAMLKDANKGRTVAATPESSPAKASASTDFSEVVLASKQRLLEDQRRLKEEIGKLQQQERELAPKLRDRLIELVLSIDPNLASLKVQAIMNREKAFLSSVGFSADAVLDYQAKQKAKKK